MRRSLSAALSTLLVASALVATTAAPAAARGDSEAVAQYFFSFAGAHEFGAP
jgi:hypothetical protein